MAKVPRCTFRVTEAQYLGLVARYGTPVGVAERARELVLRDAGLPGPVSRPEGRPRKPGSTRRSRARPREGRYRAVAGPQTAGTGHGAV